VVDRKAAVRDLLERALNRRDVKGAFEKYIHPDYRQHNPNAPDGRDAAIKGVGAFVAAFPALHYDIKQMFQDGDTVAVFAHVTKEAGDRGSAVVDILRFEGDFAVEHWDVIQPVPETAANDNGMF
jgi:predicted SnoaL-like aldol condensation-catalyzing enzyme